MSTIKFFMITIIMSLLLIGCQKQLSYSYLMHHPEVLKNEIQRCESIDVDTSQNKEKIKYCQMVIVAAARVLSILTQQQEDPEKFGEKLLMLQIVFNKTKIALHDAQKNLMTLQKQTAASQHAAQNEATVKINKAKEKRDILKKLYDEQKDEIQIMLAVIGINSPE